MPPAGLLAQRLIAAQADMWYIVASPHRALGRLPDVASVSTEMLNDAARTTYHSYRQRRPEQLHVMPIGTAHD